MFDIAISQMTTTRWDLHREVASVAAHGFDAVSVWRPKISDLGSAEAAAVLGAAGVRVSSVQWAGGFTGGDGRSFDDSIDDAIEAIELAEAVAAPVVVLHSGCRGGHTRSHALRLLGDALEVLAPRAARAGVTLALEPMHPLAGGCSFIARLRDAVALVERFDDPTVRLALDLWHWADDPEMAALGPRLAVLSAVVRVADRLGSPVAGGDRLPVGHGRLPLERVVADLVAAGYRGDVEFDPVGEAVTIAGYDDVLRETRLVADAWRASLGAAVGPLPRPRGAHFRGGGSRRSHASSQTVSPG